LIREYLANKQIKESISKLAVILLAECEKEINKLIGLTIYIEASSEFVIGKRK
jgi:hypothetical protein